MLFYYQRGHSYFPKEDPICIYTHTLYPSNVMTLRYAERSNDRTSNISFLCISWKNNDLNQVIT